MSRPTATTHWIRKRLPASRLLAAVLVSGCAHRSVQTDVSVPAIARQRAEALSPCSDSASSFRRVIAEFQSRQQNPAISVGVRHRGHTVFREGSGFASLEARTPADAAMAFSIASITEAFTAANGLIGRLAAVCGVH